MIRKVISVARAVGLGRRYYVSHATRQRLLGAVEALERRELFAQVTLDFNGFPSGFTIGPSISEDGFQIVNGSGGNFLTSSSSSPWTAAQGPTVYNNVAGATSRLLRIDGGNFRGSTIQLNSLNGFASSLVPFTYNLAAGGTSSGSIVTDSNYNSFQTFSLMSNVVSRLDWQQVNTAGDYHQFDNIVLDIGPRINTIQPAPVSAQYTALASLQVVLSDAASLPTFTFADISLTRNGSNVVLANDVTVALVSGTTYRIDGLAPYTNADGDYVLSVNARNISSTSNLDGMGTASTSWTKNSPPTVTGVSVAANAEVLPGLSSLVVNFSEAVNFSLGSVQRPATSASQILSAGPAASGTYMIDPDGTEGALAAKLVYCDMTTDGGGWMLGINSLLGGESQSNQVNSDTGTVGFTSAHTRNLNHYFAGAATADVLHEINGANLGAGVFLGKYTIDTFEQGLGNFNFLPGHSNSGLLSGSMGAPFQSTPFGSNWFWSGNTATTIPFTPSVSSIGPYYAAAGQPLTSYRIWIRGNGTGSVPNRGGAAVASNYELRARGVDGVFDTADDAVITLNSVTASTTAATLNFAGLGPGRYRLMVKDTITDGAARNLDGDANTVPGGNFLLEFTVLSPPTDIQLSNAALAENSPSGSTVGQLSSIDPDVGSTFTYTFVSGTGSTDNGSFQIAGNNLNTATSLNFESQSSYSVRIRSTDQSGLFYEESVTISVVDLPELSATPVIGDGTAQRSRVDKVVITLDGAVTIQAGAFAVNKRGPGGGAVATLATPVVNGSGQTVVTLTFSGGFTRGSALLDGYYDLAIDGSKILRGGLGLDVNQDGIGGDAYSLGTVEADNFFALFGDTNGDGLVGIAEFGQFRAAFGKTSSDVGYNSLFDYELDGAVGIGDFGQFRSRFGKPKPTFN